MQQISNNYNQQKQNQQENIQYDFLLVLDFECNGDREKKMYPCEIIEFPVVPYDLKNNKIWTDNLFQYYIKPTEHPKITQFCTDITKITQEQVDKGIVLKEALEKLDEYLISTGIIKTNFIFITCGDFDLGSCLRNECNYKGIQYKDYLKQYINIKKQFPQFLLPNRYQGKRTLGMAGMLKQMNLQLEGTHHSGIDDSKNIARIAYEMANKYNIKFTSQMCVKTQQKQNSNNQYKQNDYKKSNNSNPFTSGNNAYQKQQQQFY